MKWKAQARKISVFTCVIISSFAIMLLEGKASVNNELLYLRRINFEPLLFAVNKNRLKSYLLNMHARIGSAKILQINLLFKGWIYKLFYRLPAQGKEILSSFFQVVLSNLDHLLTKKLSISPDKLSDGTLEFWDHHCTSIDCKCKEQFQNQSLSFFCIQTSLFLLSTLCRSNCDLCSVRRIIRGILSSGGKCKKSSTFHSCTFSVPCIRIQ